MDSGVGAGPRFDKEGFGAKAAGMKLFPAFRSAAFSALLLAGSATVAFAQSPDPSATPAVVPSKPATETATPSPSAAVNTDAEAAPKKAERTADEKKARKEERLRKYDTNKDGKLDEKERAAMRADKAKAQTDKAKASPTP